MLKILATVLVCDLILGTSMALYLVFIWKTHKAAIAEQGWNTDCADPICNNMWLVCYVPVIGIMYYLVVGEAMGKLAATSKDDANGIISVYYGKLGFHYDEDHKM